MNPPAGIQAAALELHGAVPQVGTVGPAPGGAVVTGGHDLIAPDDNGAVPGHPAGGALQHGLGNVQVVIVFVNPAHGISPVRQPRRNFPAAPGVAGNFWSLYHEPPDFARDFKNILHLASKNRRIFGDFLHPASRRRPAGALEGFKQFVNNRRAPLKSPGFSL